jgi:hypothetical protein
MEYQNLLLYPNVYPSIDNYGRTLDGNFAVVGNYEKDNVKPYTNPNLNDIEVIENTSFRFILAVKESVVSDEIRYFTSQPFYDDLLISITENNPFFINNALNDNLFIRVTLDKQIALFNDLKLIDLGTGVKQNQNLFLVADNTIDYITLVQYIDWVVSSVNPLDDDTNGVLPAEKIADYEIGEYNPDTGEFTPKSEKAVALANRLEELYFELEDIEEAIAAMQGDIPAEPKKRKTSVLEIISLGLGAVSVAKGATALKTLVAAEKASKVIKTAGEAIVKTERAITNVANLNQAGMTALQNKVVSGGLVDSLGNRIGAPTITVTKELTKRAFNFKNVVNSVKTAATKVGNTVSTATTFVGNKTKQVSGLINRAAGTQLGAATITTAIAASGVVQSSKGSVQAKGAVVKNVLKEVRKTATIELGKAIVKKAITKGIIKGAGAKILGAATGPIGAGIMAAVGIVKFFVGKAKQKKEFKKQKEAYDKSMAELERLTKRKEDIEFEINNITKSGKLTLDGKPKGDDRFSSTQKYFQNIGKSILEKQQQQTNSQTAFG